MNESVERHVSITTMGSDGSVTYVAKTSVHVSDEGGDGNRWFDPETCCDERERALIAAMRAYLRPERAPQCLVDRLKDTLDRCCEDSRTH
ncbi:hypothetical protein [Bifidobacterium sp. UBA6881]|uniref:hypothetical protein n=1 Tax=Bifidobacterium sp. UBA6881 TaxID=1946109 RepID=UPI000EC66B8E|nr:hypothetical protein [Bifidobacterium sp. UBA6881]HAK71297.1 hypothetical protein [Bifidobacterium sp.]HCH22327.1 hypothetical protein [Bifidobacterium sp.]